MVGCCAAKEDKPGLLTLLVEDCLKNPYVWLFAISYFFVYVVRQGVTSWFIFYLKVLPLSALTCRIPLPDLPAKHLFTSFLSAWSRHLSAWICLLEWIIILLRTCFLTLQTQLLLLKSGRTTLQGLAASFFSMHTQPYLM